MAIHVAIDMSEITISSERSEIKKKKRKKVVVNRILSVSFGDVELGPCDDLLGVCVQVSKCSFWPCVCKVHTG